MGSVRLHASFRHELLQLRVGIRQEMFDREAMLSRLGE